MPSTRSTRSSTRSTRSSTKTTTPDEEACSSSKTTTPTPAEAALVKAQAIAARLTQAALTTGGSSSAESAVAAVVAEAVTVPAVPVPAVPAESVPAVPVVAAAAIPAVPVVAAVTPVPAPAPAPTERERKRKKRRWGSVETAAPEEAIPGLAAAQAAATTVTEAAAVPNVPTSQRIWVPTSREKPETHFSSFLHERLFDLLIQINTDFNGDEKNKMELAGRGSAAAEKIIGMPLEPMHVMLYGAPEFLTTAAPRLEELLAEGERADREGPPTPELEDGTHDTSQYTTSGALTLTRSYYDGPTAASRMINAAATTTSNALSSYKPATVAQLIGTNPDVLGTHAGDATMIEEVMKIPNGIVGFIIGRGGETIKSMQARSGCKVQIQKEHELQPGQTERVITLQALTQESIEDCRGIIEKIVMERVTASGGGNRAGSMTGGSVAGHYGQQAAGIGGGGGGRMDNTATKVQEAVAEGHKLVQVDVPDADVGLVIGKGGVTIKFIQSSTGSNVHIPHSANTGEGSDPSVRTVSITCPTQEGADSAKIQIEQILQNKRDNEQKRQSYLVANAAAAAVAANGGGAAAVVGAMTGQYGGPGVGAMAPQPVVPQASVQVAVPHQDVGLCIGRQGSVIKHLQEKTKTRINIPQEPVGDLRIITVTGPSIEACNEAKNYIEVIMREKSVTSIMAGTYQNNNNNFHQNQYSNHAMNNYQQQQNQNQYNGGGGGYYQNNYRQPRNNSYQQQQQVAATTQSSDPAWQAYHAAQALATKQQQEQQQAAAVAAAVVAAATQQQPASDTYYEQFHRYAYYYGEDAARQYYGTWSPPIGTANPYGVNPAGITNPPPADAASAPGAATATAQVVAGGAGGAPAARDSSVRKVSNLPAWMTQ